MNLTNVHKYGYLIPGLSGLGSSIVVSCPIGCRCSADLALLWLRHRPAAAALIQLIPWELPHALKRPKKKKEKKKASVLQTSTRTNMEKRKPPAIGMFQMLRALHSV